MMIMDNYINLEKSEKHDVNVLCHALLVRLLFAAFFLVPLCPIGIFNGINSIWFSLFVYSHYILLLSCLPICLRIFLNLNTGKWRYVYYFVVSVVSVLIILLDLLPITSRDALIHHLAIPQIWIKEGYIHEVPWHSWSHYPMLIQLAYVGLMKINLVSLTQFYHFLYLPILSALAASLAATISKEKQAGILAFILCFILPINIKLASIPLVDLPLAVFSLAAVILLFRSIQSELDNNDQFLLGLAFCFIISTKPNGFLALFLLVLFALFEMKKNIKTCKRIFFSLFVCGALFFPWAIKNYINGKSPLYPFFNGYFEDKSKVSLEELAKNPEPKASSLFYRYFNYGENLANLISLPVRIFTEGEDDNPRNFDGVFSPLLLLALVPFGWLRKDNKLRFIYLYSIAYLCLSLLFGPARIRYLTPIYGSLCVLTAINPLRRYANILIIVQVFLTTNYLYGLINQTSLLSYLQTRDTTAYLRENIPEYRMIEYMNENLGKDSLTYLILTGNQYYYYSNPTFSDGFLSQKRVIDYIKSSNTPEDVAGKFKSQNISHLFAYAPRVVSAFEFLNDQEKSLWNSFAEKHLRLLKEQDGFMLWVIER